MDIFSYIFESFKRQLLDLAQNKNNVFKDNICIGQQIL